MTAEPLEFVIMEASSVGIKARSKMPYDQAMNLVLSLHDRRFVASLSFERTEDGDADLCVDFRPIAEKMVLYDESRNVVIGELCGPLSEGR